MVFGMAKPKYKKSTISLGMRGRDAARKLTLKVDILHVFMIDFSEIQLILNHNSQSDGQHKSANSGMNLHLKSIRIVSLQRKREDTKDNGISPRTKQAKMGLWNFRSGFRAAVSLKNCLHHESGEQIEEPTSPGQYRRWHPSSSTSWWDTSERSWKWAHKNFLSDLLFVTVGFVYSRWRSTVTDGVDRYTSHVKFLMQFAHSIKCISHCMAQDELPNVSVCALLMSSMMCVWLSVGCFLVLSFSCFSPLLTSSLPHSTRTLPGTPSPMSTPPRFKSDIPSSHRNGPEVSKVQRPVCTPRWHCERQFWFWCSIHRVEFVSITNDGGKSNVCHSKATRMCRTGSRRRVRIKWQCNAWERYDTCSFAVQTQIATRELPWTTDEDSHCADVTTDEDTITLTEKHKTENRSSTHVQILCSSTESPCTCQCTVKLYRTLPWILARATFNMPRVEKYRDVADAKYWKLVTFSTEDVPS